MAKQARALTEWQMGGNAHHVSTKAKRKSVDRTADRVAVALAVGAGRDPIEVAETMGMTPGAVRRATTEVVRRYGVAGPSTIDEARKLLAHSSGRAAQRIAELIESDDEQVALKAAGTTLDRVGIGAKSTMQLDVRRTSDAELESEALEAARLLLNVE